MMMLVFLSLFFVLFTTFLNVNVVAQILLGDCDFKSNISDVAELPRHKQVLLEDCLYTNLSIRANEEQKKPNAIFTLPPTKNTGDDVPLTLHNLIVRQLWINEMWKEMHVSGYMEISWMDYRFIWSPHIWKLTTMSIKSFGQIWVPDLFPGRIGTVSQGNDFTVYKDIMVSNAGNFTVKLEFRMQALCDSDYYEYPKERKNCCFYLHPNLFASILSFKILSNDGKFDPFHEQNNWDVPSVRLANMKNDDGSPVLEVCLVAYRRSSTLKIELTVPMVISAILVLVAPLFGPLKHQLWVKLFALLLQYLCFQYLVEKTPQVGLGGSVPKIYKFYEFTIAMTLVSLAITLVTSALSRVRRVLPPPHRLNLCTSVVNNYMCCYEPDASGMGDDPETKAHSMEWKEVFACINNVMSLLLLVVYVLTTLVMCA